MTKSNRVDRTIYECVCIVQYSTYAESVERIAQLHEAHVELPAEVVGESAVVVIDAEIRATHFANSQLLLL